MKQTLLIPGRLPSMNDIIDGSKTLIRVRGKRRTYQYTKDKQWFSGKIADLCHLQRLVPMAKVGVQVVFREKRISRDPDNIIAGIKFILDGLTKAGVIRDDSFQYVKAISFGFEAEAEENQIIVSVEEV